MKKRGAGELALNFFDFRDAGVGRRHAAGVRLVTKKQNFRGEVAEPIATMRESVLKRWHEYGFK
ncbi:MAG: hypothetical protein ACREQ7_05195 [Candidatus Binatia bacterium]